MTDKRNIVIKVKYPVSGKAPIDSAPRMVTEWNIKRILIAVSVLVLMLILLTYVITNDEQKSEVDNAAITVNAIDKSVTPQAEVKETETKNLAIPKQAIEKYGSSVKQKKEPYKETADMPVNRVIKKPANNKIIVPKAAHNVSKAVLTYKINNKEPAGETVRTVEVNRKKPIWVYYFTELNAMKGNKVYHEWLKNGAVVSKQELLVSTDTWRTSSRKLLSDSERGNWAVRLVDKNGRLLNQKNFKVE